MKLEIVSHCWQYSRLLRYQLSSLFLFPPESVQVLMSVVLCPEDLDTVAAVRFFQSLPPVQGLTVRPWPMPKGQLFVREIGRNQIALTTDADWVWFTDCDYLFRAGALDALASAVQTTAAPLVFPRDCWVNCSHEIGDRTVEGIPAVHNLADIDPNDFEPKRNTRAFGGIQIARKEVLHRLGYCRYSPRQNWIAKRWKRTMSDVIFRKSLKTRGTPLSIPNVFRIRHTRKGRFDPATIL